MSRESWLEARQYTPDKLATARKALEEVRQGREVWDAVRRNPLPGGGYMGKHLLVAAYRQLVESKEWEDDPAFLASIRMKPIRTLSGVTTVTVLTKPAPCPGHCIFCPTDVCMPKSYLPDEPGGKRALENKFDPYDQVISRLNSLEAVGHPTDKIELLILGGTWSSYPHDYQEWFIRRCFDAMNGVSLNTLEDAFAYNETASHRNVGLVIETRPDKITADELIRLRKLGVTKVQMGAQSLDNHILSLNQRGHTAEETLSATTMLRAAGFKIVLHWMPNLLGATLESDRLDFARLWQGYCPDEIKIYPTQLLANSELYQIWQQGEYKPYTQEELVSLIADIKPIIPRYCRVNRVIRDIPSHNVIEGNKRTSLRQDIQSELEKRGVKCECIRCREIRNQTIDPSQLRLDDLVYEAAKAEEHFLSYITPDDKLAGYIRLSLPKPDAPQFATPDLNNAAIIREVHVYGQSLPVGVEQQGVAQHAGLGTALLEAAEKTAYESGFTRMAVIAAIGTRQYYIERGFERGDLYLVKLLTRPVTWRPWSGYIPPQRPG
jgi:elongator complex protein 3